MSLEDRSAGAPRLKVGRQFVLIEVRSDLVSSTFLKTGGKRKLQRVGRQVKPGAGNLRGRSGVALVMFSVYVCLTANSYLFGKG